VHPELCRLALFRVRAVAPLLPYKEVASLKDERAREKCWPAGTFRFRPFRYRARRTQTACTVRWKQLVGGSRYRAGPVARLRLGGEQRVPATTGGAEWATANAHPCEDRRDGPGRGRRGCARATEHRARCEVCPPAL